MWWLIGLAVLAVLAYVAWELRWYLRTLRRTWRAESDREDAPKSREPELAGRR